MLTNICKSTMDSLCYMTLLDECFLSLWVVFTGIIVRMACICIHLEFFQYQIYWSFQPLFYFYNVLHFYLFSSLFFMHFALVTIFFVLAYIKSICINLYYLDISSQIWVFMGIIWSTYQKWFPKFHFGDWDKTSS